MLVSEVIKWLLCNIVMLLNVHCIVYGVQFDEHIFIDVLQRLPCKIKFDKYDRSKVSIFIRAKLQVVK